MSDPNTENMAKSTASDHNQPQQPAAIGDLTVTYISQPEPMDTVVPDSAAAKAEDSTKPNASPVPGVAAEPISRFRIVRPHAKGGLGEVSIAADTELNREVALKEIQARFAGDIPNRMRFVLEAEVTGALEHPGIVPVYGLGQYQDGRPYYAMRFVRGDSLKQAVDHFHQSGGLTSEPREFRALLGRLVDVCNAIEYAHSRGVLHRDIKPSNVMLGEYGETLVVDWGLAKVLGRDDLEFASEKGPVAVTSGDSAQTLDGSTIGTPAFMPPEQAAGDLKNLGPTADVYSLGATLFYILTGTPPVTGDNLVDILKNVQSGNLNSARDINPNVPAALSSIAAKALTHDTAERYQSPKSLADEIERWLDDEPVLAHRDPQLERIRRWARRHPKSVTATVAALLLGLSSAAAIATVVAGKNSELADANTQLEQAYEAQRQATLAMDEAREKAEEQRQIADNKAAEANAVLQFFEEKVLAAARPEGQDGGLGIDVTVRKAIDNAATTLEDAFAEQPSVEATIRKSLADTYGLLGEFSLAEIEAAAAVELMKTAGSETDLLDTESSLMEYVALAGRVEETVAPLQRIHARQTELLGVNHQQTLNTACNLATSYANVGRNEEAIELFKPTLTGIKANEGADSQTALSAANNMIMPMLALGQNQEAKLILEELVELSIRKFGPKHPDTLTYLGNLSSILSSTEDYDRALEITERVLITKTKLLGDTHPATLTARSNRANLVRLKGQPEEAIDEMAEVSRLANKTLGPNHPDTLQYDSNLAAAYMHVDQAESAVQIYESLLPRQQKLLGPSHPRYLMSLVASGMAFTETGQTKEARLKLEDAKKSYAKLYGKDSEYVTALEAMITNLDTANDASEDRPQTPN